MLDPGSAVHHPHLPPTHTAEKLRGQRAKLVVQCPRKLGEFSHTHFLYRGGWSEQYYHNPDIY